MNRLLTSLSIALALGAGACGEPPEPVGSSTATATESVQPPPAEPFEASGTIELRGELETTPNSRLYVSVGLHSPQPDKPNRLIPWLSKQYELTDLERVDDGWVVEYTISDATDAMMQRTPGALSIKAAFSPSGDAMDSSLDAIQEVSTGDSVDFVLE